MTKPKRRHRRIGTIVYYGPTNDFATKLVATVVAEGRRGDVIAMRTWMSELGDIRSDRRVATDVTHFLSKYHVAETVTADRLLGCPHQEGVDYPMGRKCPRCPFWADIDRMTYEPIVPPEPAMSPEEVLDVLWREQREPPIEALESADAHRLALVGPLIDAIDRVVAHPARSSTRDNGLFTYAVYLLAKWRETRAYPCIVRWLSLSTEGHDTISGDLYTQDGARILAAVCDGNLEPIARLIRNPQVDEFARSVAAGALANLAAWGETPRDQVIDVFRSLINGGLERTACYVWAGVYCSAIDMEATELYPELQQAFDEGLVDPQVAGEHALDEAALIVPGTAIEDLRDRWPPIDDVAEAIAWWGGFHDASGEDYEDGDGDGNEFGDEDSDLEFGEPQQPYVAPAKVGRNDPCPCGSGQKFKKCHGG